MYIKQVIIQGFRSYRDQTIVEPFSPKHNVIVGRNGSGKSNFFYAIQFVLSDEFSHLRADQRQSLLHEGTGPRSFVAFVEIVFDNTDNRLPFDKDEVRLRRMIGAKKDQYFIDMKVVTKQDVMSLLESAGFSRSNPYYIVKQGKINELATAPDHYRLKLLREVAGTRVYDERKEESKAILKETENKREKIDELLKYIDDRLKTLEEEKEELKEYQKWDKMRRSLEYTIYDRELQDAKRKLDELSQKRERLNTSSTKTHDDQQEVAERLYTVQKRLRDLERRFNGQEEERAQLAQELSERTASKTKLELTISDLLDEVDGERSNRTKAREELRTLTATIDQKEDRLREIAPHFNQLVQREQDLSTRLAIAEQKRRELGSKRGWTERFANKGDRDAWIKKNIKKLKSQIDDVNDQIKKLRSELSKEEAEAEAVDRELKGNSQKTDMDRENIEQMKKKHNALKQERDQLQNERHELWREETNKTAEVTAAKEELEQAEMSLRGMTSKGIMQGIDGVTRVLQTFRDRGTNQEVLDGYYGTLIENFSTDRQFRTAVEVTAGNRLFYHIVRHDQFGTKILAEFNKQKLHGEVNFFPLNRLDARDAPDHSTNPKDAVPMIEKLNFNEQYAPVMKHVFGRTLICRNMEVATQLARQCGLDCITLEGDQVSHKGSLTGGYLDNKRSRLQLQETRMTLRQKLADLEDGYHRQRGRLNQIEGLINAKISEMQKLETDISKARDEYEKAQQRVKTLREQKKRLNESKEPKEKQLVSLNHTLQLSTAQKENYDHDLTTELLSQLTADEQSELESLQTQTDQLKSRLNDVTRERSALEREKNTLDNQLQTNLLRKKEELQSQLQEISVEDQRTLLEANQSELQMVNARIKEINRSLAEVESQLEDFYSKKKDLESEIDQLQTKERDFQSKINDELKEIEKVTSKQTSLSKKKDEFIKKIRELGLLPEAHERYQNLGVKQLYNQLEKCNQELKKYENVNKKALDQFVNFSEQKEKLKKRKEELDRGHESIVQLIEGLDQRKYDAIQLTFKQVSRYFEEVLARLAPGARAQLIMRNDGAGEESTSSSQTSQSQSQSQASSDVSRGPVPLIEQFTGIGLTVAFSGADETREMQQLSGGQKSLVALALIFAIQKCDPAPFYLFDEIDAAMDPQHRKAVADMIHDLSSNAQFITTTFRRELLENAHKFYGVRFRNKVSHIDCVTKEEAADFVEDDTTHG